MADRYWVGGAGTWNTTSTTNWSASSGGSSGASVPTSADNVFFNQAATYTVTCTGALACNNITVSAGTVTFATGTTPTFSINGSMSLSTGTVWSATGAITFAGGTTGKTVTTNGTTLSGAVTFSAAGGGWTLGGAFTISGALTVTEGTFSTGGYAVSASGLSSNNSNTRTITLGASAVALTSGVPITFTTATNLTFNANTSTFNCSNLGATFAGNGLTFYNVNFTNAPISVLITGDNIFNNLTFAGRTTLYIGTVTFSGNQTISGTLTLNAGTSAAYRTMLRSDTIGTQRTLSVATLASGAADYDFRDIAITGAASPISGTRFGDCKGNSGITFDAPKTVYYRNTGSANWGSASPGSWSRTNGGSADETAFPLAQDTAVFPAATYPASGSTTTMNGYNIGTVDMSLRTSNTMTLAGVASQAIYGNWINGTGITISGTGVTTFAGRGSQTITSSGKTFTQPFAVDSPGGSVTLQDAFSSNRSGINVFVLTNGTFDASSYKVTLSGATSSVGTSNSNTRTLAFGSGTWTLSGSGTTFDASTSTNLTVTGNGTISLTSASAKTFAGGGVQTYPTLNQGGTGALTVSGSNKFAGMTNSAIGSVLFTGGTTNEFDSFDLNGVAGTLLTLGSTNTTQAILKKPGAWSVGANSTDGGNNSGLSFI